MCNSDGTFAARSAVKKRPAFSTAFTVGSSSAATREVCGVDRVTCRAAGMADTQTAEGLDAHRAAPASPPWQQDARPSRIPSFQPRSVFKMPFRRISACQEHGVLGVLERQVNEVQWPNFNGSPRCSPGSRLPVLSPPERWGRVRRLRWRLQRAFGDYRRLYGKIVVELRDSDSHMRPCRSVWARNRNPSIVVT